MFNIINSSKSIEDMCIRIDNFDNHELRLLDGKLNYIDSKHKKNFVNVHLMPYHIFESSSCMDIAIKNYPKDNHYCSLSFIVNDYSVNKIYLIELSLTTKDLKIKNINQI